MSIQIGVWYPAFQVWWFRPLRLSALVLALSPKHSSKSAGRFTPGTTLTSASHFQSGLDESFCHLRDPVLSLPDHPHQSGCVNTYGSRVPETTITTEVYRIHQHNDERNCSSQIQYGTACA
jgi:hypothetical protein